MNNKTIVVIAAVLVVLGVFAYFITKALRAEVDKDLTLKHVLGET